MKRLYRNESDVMIAGVCSGLGKYLDVDPTAIRLAFVLLLFVGLGGLWIYLVLWIIMPVDPGQKNDVIKVEPGKKAPAPKKVAVSKHLPVKKPIVKKVPEKKTAAKQPAVKTTSKKKPTVKTNSVEEKKE
jgi:phage shock protein C